MAERWTNFYLLTGTAAVTLIGLIFIVMTMGAGAGIRRSSDYLRLLVGPTLANYGLIVLCSALMLFPDLRGFGRSLVVAVIGTVGFVHCVWVAVRLTRANLEGIEGVAWLRNHGVSMAVYLVLAGSGVVTAVFDVRTSAVVASAVLTLLAFSLYRSWDSVVWLAEREPPQGGNR